MCKSIHTLYSADQPALQGEIHAAAWQYVRKISGFTAPSRADAAVFMAAADEIADSSARLLSSLQPQPSKKEPITGDTPLAYHSKPES